VEPAYRNVSQKNKYYEIDGLPHFYSVLIKPEASYYLTACSYIFYYDFDGHTIMSKFFFLAMIFCSCNLQISEPVFFI
jgi:hypothetical protein